MDANAPTWAAPGEAEPRDDAGVTIRLIRQANGPTLAQLGHRIGYSASQVSRYECGLAPLTVAVLRRFAIALAIPPQAFGLLPRAVPHDPRIISIAPGATTTVAVRPEWRMIQCGDGGCWRAWS